MSENNKKTTNEEQTPKGEKTKLSMKGALLIVLAAIALIGIVVGIIVAVTNDKKKSIFDYSEKELKSLVYVPEHLYKNYNVTVKIPEITDADVYEEIVKLQCAYKKDPEATVDAKRNVVISAGDIVNTYYRGYTMENGVKTYFDGGCNFAETTASPIQIGAGKFIPGFETGLIGKNAMDYSRLTKLTSGTVAAGDIISFTYSVMYADGTSKPNQTATIDLTDPEKIDETWGEGFYEYIIGKTIDPNKTFGTGDIDDKGFFFPTTCEGHTGQDTYFDMKISGACRISTDKDTLVIEVRFPYEYTDKALEGKVGYFEIYVIDVHDYTAPEFDEAFITDILKVKAEDMSSYTGATLVDKYKDYIKKELIANREAEVKAAVEEAFWKQVMEGAEIKSLPENEVERYYNNSLSQLESDFSNYTDYYNNDFNAFARASLGLTSGADWRAQLRYNAEESVKQRLVFYYIVKTEKLQPTEEEYNALYEVIFAEHLQDYLDYYEITESTPNYQSLLEAAKKTVKETYGEEYWEELVLYDYAMDVIISRANVIVA